MEGQQEVDSTLASWDKDARRAHIGYDLDPEFWGKGIMREALAELLRFGFETINLNRVQCLIRAENGRSVGLIEGLGS